ncbi:MAG: hypothetical protein II680_09480, partial [Clostridia bacterium]|nr:hypothetical protein [Clostridia bacterium]
FTPLEKRPEWFREPLFSLRFGPDSGTDAKTVVHPKYGLGVILDVEDKPSVVHVRFADVGVKELSREWIERNCKIN